VLFPPTIPFPGDARGLHSSLAGYALGFHRSLAGCARALHRPLANFVRGWCYISFGHDHDAVEDAPKKQLGRQ
jgi:hypothetical protein